MRFKPRLAPLAAALVLGGGLIAAVGASAQRASETAIEVFADAALGALRLSGARVARRGPVTIDAGAGTIAIADIEVEHAAPDPMRVTVRRVSARGARLDGTRMRAEEFGFDDLRFAFEDGEYRIDGVRARDVSAPVIPPFGIVGQTAPNLADLFTGLDAQRITVALVEARSRRGRGREEGSWTLERIAIDEVRAGVAARAVIGGQAWSFVLDGRRARMSGGYTTFDGFDVGVNVADLMGTGEPRPDGRLVTRLMTMDEMSGTVDDARTRISLGRTVWENMRIRPRRAGVLDEQRRAPIDLARFNASLVRTQANALEDLADSFHVARVAFGPITIEGPDAYVRVDRAIATDFGPIRAREITVEGVRAGNARERYGVESLTASDIDLATPLAAMIAATRANPGVDLVVALESRMPHVGRLAVRGLDVDRPDTGRVTAESAELTLGRSVGLVPSDVALAVTRLRFTDTLVARRLGPSLADLGYRVGEVSGDIKIAIDEVNQRMTLRPGRVSLAEGGSVSLEVDIGAMDARLFTVLGFTNVAPFLQRAHVEGVRLRLENDGLLERVGRWNARRGGPDARRMLEQFAEAFIPAVRRNVRDPETVRESIDALVDNPRALTLTLTPSRRITFADLIGANANGVLGYLVMLQTVEIGVDTAR